MLKGMVTHERMTAQKTDRRWKFWKSPAVVNNTQLVDAFLTP